MVPRMEHLIKVALVLIAIPYVLGPVAVLIKQRFPERYAFTKLDSEKFFKDQTSKFMELHLGAIRAGFTHLGCSEFSQGNVNANFSVYLDQVDRTFCLLSTFKSSLGETTQIEFTRVYEDTSVTNVNNNAMLNVYPRHWRKETYRLPEISDFTALLDAANRIFSLRGGERSPINIGLEPGWGLVESHLNQELDSLVERGWVSGVVRDGERRPTIKGALLMTWKLCWPVKTLLNWVDVRNAKNALDSA